MYLKMDLNSLTKQFTSFSIENDKQLPKTPILLSRFTPKAQDSLIESLIQNLKENKLEGEMKGAIIFTYSRLSAMQLYSKFRSADLEDEFKVTRLGSVHYLAPHIDFIVILFFPFKQQFRFSL